MWRRKMLCVSQVVLLRRESTTDAQHADSVGTHVFCVSRSHFSAEQRVADGEKGKN